MPPLLAQSTVYQNVVPVYMLDGMTLLIGAFFFWCLARPERVKNRGQFWATFVVLLSITLLYALRLMLYNSPAGQVLCGVAVGVLQAVGLVLTVMYVGGLRPGEIAGGLRDAADEFRRGEPLKSTVVPLTSERTPPVEPPPAAAPVPPRVVIELPKRDAGGSIPVE